eukprot:9137970-Lingulodinium_polyedra.AAC.1
MAAAWASTSLGPQATWGSEVTVLRARVSGREFLDVAAKAIEGRGPALPEVPEDRFATSVLKVRDDIEADL